MDRGNRAVAMSEDHVLAVAGTDSSGGAGLVRDIETIAAFGLRACLACTAVTAQTHSAVVAVEYMPPDLVVRQMKAALEADPVKAVKIGMLGRAATVEAVASVLGECDDIPIVLDPVLVATSGGRLLDGPGVQAMCRRLLQKAVLLTPNWHELAFLTRTEIAASEDEALSQARDLQRQGARNILVKGGHAPGARGNDLLVKGDGAVVRFEGSELPASMRGTGCVLSSAIAAGLARGNTMEEAVSRARSRVRQLLQDQSPASWGPDAQRSRGIKLSRIL